MHTSDWQQDITNKDLTKNPSSKWDYVNTSADPDIYSAIMSTQDLCEVLNLRYPLTQKIIGEEKFSEAVSIYIEKIQFKDFTKSLEQYGEKFSSVFSDIESYAVFLKGFVELEWAIYISKYRDAFYLLNEKAHKSPQSLLDFKSLFDSGFHPESLRFSLSPSLILLKNDFKIYEIWKWAQSSIKKNIKNEESIDIDSEFLTKEKQYLVVYRQEDQLKVEIISAHLWVILKNFQDGKPLEEAIHNVYTLDSMTKDLEKDLKFILKKGWIVSVDKN